MRRALPGFSRSSAPNLLPNSGFNGGWSRAFQRLVALAMALVLLPLAQVEVFAQQAPWPGSPQYGQYPQNGPYSGQYAPNQQPGYAQPGYAQPATRSPTPSSPPHNSRANSLMRTPAPDIRSRDMSRHAAGRAALYRGAAGADAGADRALS